jgi:hypothetical protein
MFDVEKHNSLIKMETKYFLIFSPNSSADIIGITDNEEFAKSFKGVFVGYTEVKFLDPTKWRSDRVLTILSEYHERDCGSMVGGMSQICSCCGASVLTTISVEYNSMDFKKDLHVCIDCYSELIEHRPCPQE